MTQWLVLALRLNCDVDLATRDCPSQHGDRHLQTAAQLLETLMTSREFPEFLTLASCDLLD
jgi:hypothetical protein